MNIDQFVILDAVVRLGSFSAASRELNRVQSAISYNIKMLEEELGIGIFSRETYRPSLTPQGKAVYRKAKELLLNVAEIQQLSAQLNLGQEARIRFDLTPSCPIDVVAPVLKRVAETYPETSLDISMEVFGGERLVLENRTDISLTDVVDIDDGLEIKDWRQVQLRPVIGRSHPLAAVAGDAISRAKMINHVQIVVASGSQSNQSKTLGVMQGNRTWAVSDMHVKKAFIRQGLGWGNLPMFMIEKEIAEGTLIQLNLPDMQQQTANLKLVRRMGMANGPVARFLWDALCDCVGAG